MKIKCTLKISTYCYDFPNPLLVKSLGGDHRGKITGGKSPGGDHRGQITGGRSPGEIIGGKLLGEFTGGRSPGGNHRGYHWGNYWGKSLRGNHLDPYIHMHTHKNNNKTITYLHVS